jgi:uncharacterized membrane protein
METFRNVLRLLYMVLGGLLAFSGFFWALQGAGVIMWPKESFMLADPVWIRNGLITAALGLGLVWVLRGRRA